MSNTVKKVSFETVMSEFDDWVHEELQNSEKLQGTCQEYDSLGADQNIPYFDQLSMEKGDFGSGDIPVVDVPQRNVQVFQDNHRLKTIFSNGYQTEFAYSIVQNHVKQHAHAISRFNDYMKLQALIVADSEFTDENNNLITSTDLSVQNLIDAKFMLIDNGVIDDRMSMYTSARNMPSFFKDSDFKSWDQNSARPLMKGSIGHYMGVDIRVLGSASKENKLPESTGPDNYVVDYNSLIVKYNRRPKTTVHLEDSQDRISILSVATAGSVVSNHKGILKITTTTK